MICTHCGKENRPEAKFCRFCGTALAGESTQKGLIGKDSIVDELDRLDEKLRVAKIVTAGGARMGMDCLVLGDSGSGKHFIAHLVADKIRESGVVKQAAKEVDAADWAEFAGDFDKNIAALKDGILLITNAQKLLPTSKASEVNQLDKLFHRMRNVEGAPIVILCGDHNDLANFLENNKDVHRLFEFDFRLGAFGLKDLTDLTLDLLKNKYKIDFSDNLPKKLNAHFAWFMRQTNLGHTNGHLSEMVAESLYVKAMSRGGKMVEPQDIDTSECFIPKTEEQILAELDNYIGLQSVKDEIKAIIRNVKAKKENGVKDKLITDHFIFTGNPGTGKTTFARKFGEVLNAVGALPTGQFVEISGKDFIGRYLGDSEDNVKKYVNKAMGGVLFIDEAYALNTSYGDGHAGYGGDAVNTLLTLLENRKGEFVCIMAGYTKEMGDFVRMNPGLPRRLNVTIEFPDYSARELEQLFRLRLAHNDENVTFTLDSKAEEMLPKVFDRMWLKRGDTFGNAGEVRNLFDLAVKRHRLRGAQDCILSYADIVGEDATEEISVEDIMKELDGLVGMTQVKETIRRIAGEIATQKRLIEMGEASEGLTKYNFVITGNPGTGKTTVARIFGKIFKALGVTASDRVVEKKPENIISKFVNESSEKMNDAINEAMGCVLFLDEAYGLDPMDSRARAPVRRAVMQSAL
ncbi:MAG: AAA family ATPase [Bacteroidales bacterium]|nr:AAA family ATPase [Bacteroidales bacterium]